MITVFERRRAPWFFCWHAMYSKAISHMPSRSEVMISASARK